MTAHARRRLRAPTDDGGVLVDPPWPELAALVDENRAALDAVELGPWRLGATAGEARAELVVDALAYTRAYRDVSAAFTADERTAAGARRSIVLAGHQPEMFHPGVWAKNFALARLAERCRAVPINLVIDGDLLRASSLSVPTGDVEQPRTETVPFDAAAEAVPYEERRLIDAATFGSFAHRAGDVLRPLVAEPLLRSWWPSAVAAVERCDGLLGLGTAQARHRLEADWGLQTLEYPQSRLCESRGFARFSAALSARLPELHAAYNGALADYRRAERIRSADHPVPALATDGERREGPWWIWTSDDPRRRRAWFRIVGGALELSDGRDVRIRLPHGSSQAVETAAEILFELPRRGIRLRSRALLTTMYVRLMLGDLFLHGIGGGNYDELTDEIVRRFFGVEPPRFGVVSATLRLPIAGRPTRSADEVAAARRKLWELTHHPERFVDAETLPADAAARARHWCATKRRWAAVTPSRARARERCRHVREANVALQSFLVERRRQGEENLSNALRRARSEAILGSREFSSFLFPEKDLRNFLLVIGEVKR